MKDSIKKFVLSNWSLSEKTLLAADILLLGVLIGWLTSPLKNGFQLFSGNFMGNGNGNTSLDDGVEIEVEDDEEDEEEE